MIGKNFIKRGLVVGLVSLAALGMLAVSGGASSVPGAIGQRTGASATSTGQGQNGQCDRAGFANADASTSIPAFPTVTTVATITNYKHPCAGPLLFNAFTQLLGGVGYGAEVLATCVSGCSGSTYGHPGGGVFYYHSFSSSGYNMHPYSGSFPNLGVGIYNISLLLTTGGGTGSVSARSLQVQSYSGPTSGGGGIGG